MSRALDDYDFDLPPRLIAQHPLPQRASSDLLVASGGRQIEKRKFYEIIDYFNPGDVLVFNDSKVLNTRLITSKNGKKLELFLHKKLGPDQWLAFAKPSKILEAGDVFSFDENKISVLGKQDAGQVTLKLDLTIPEEEFFIRYGLLPLPPYIKRADGPGEVDAQRYQTVFAKSAGSVAAPTASLHFTSDLINALQAKGVICCFITLHVGAGTFLPIKTEDIAQHKMHSELVHITPAAAASLNLAIKEGRRIIASGTTALRSIESAYLKSDGSVEPGLFETDIFITKREQIKITNMMITNFHLPKSTLFILVCAFIGYDNARRLYAKAIEEQMRFFSYGDASLLYLSQN